MSTKYPVIKFSPFEALLIGEKNKILKRQGMKNTIFVTRINQRSKTFNLRDLFGLEKDNSRCEAKEAIFKMPQRVRDFLKNRKLKGKGNSNSKDEEILYFDYRGQKMVLKNKDTMKSMVKKLKTNKVKFKKKLNFKSKLENKVVRKFPHHYSSARCKSTNSKKLKSSPLKQGAHKKKVLIRGKDGRFISKKEYEKLNSNAVHSTQKYFSKYLHLYVKNKNLCDNDNVDKNLNSNVSTQLVLENNKSVPNICAEYNVLTSEDLLKFVFDEYYDSSSLDFQFPRLALPLINLDFEEDANLLDLIYENFPSVKFKSEDIINDFSDALRNAEILEPEKSLKMYEKKKNIIYNSEKLAVIFNNHLPFIKFRRLGNSSLKYCKSNVENGCVSDIDEPYTEKNHLIKSKGFDCLFFRSVEGKDIFIGNLIKSFWNNSWFGTLPHS